MKNLPRVDLQTIFTYLIPFLVFSSLLVDQSQCAPAVEGDEVDGGCYYMFNHYGEGDRILTNEPCLNCTCHNSMLMCYLRVCPFTKPIGQDCTAEKKPDQCCPVISCPQVPVSLVTPSALTSTTVSTTSLASVTESTELATFERGCEIEGKYYSDGAQIIGDPSKPCELCYCIRNKTACVMQECILHVEGCEPVFQAGVCCPVRYQCDYPLQITDQSTIAGLITTTISSIFSSTLQPGGCMLSGEYYADGSQIPAAGPEPSPCEHCYCMRGEVVCAVQECGAPLENEGANCTAIPPGPGFCCPEKYTCESDNGEMSDDTTVIPSLISENISSQQNEDSVQPQVQLADKSESQTESPESSQLTDVETLSEKVGPGVTQSEGLGELGSSTEKISTSSSMQGLGTDILVDEDGTLKDEMEIHNLVSEKPVSSVPSETEEKDGQGVGVTQQSILEGIKGSQTSEDSENEAIKVSTEQKLTESSVSPDYTTQSPNQVTEASVDGLSSSSKTTSQILEKESTENPMQDSNVGEIATTIPEKSSENVESTSSGEFPTEKLYGSSTENTLVVSNAPTTTKEDLSNENQSNDGKPMESLVSEFEQSTENVITSSETPIEGSTEGVSDDSNTSFQPTAKPIEIATDKPIVISEEQDSQTIKPLNDKPSEDDNEQDTSTNKVSLIVDDLPLESSTEKGAVTSEDHSSNVSNEQQLDSSSEKPFVSGSEQEIESSTEKTSNVDGLQPIESVTEKISGIEYVTSSVESSTEKTQDKPAYDKPLESEDDEILELTTQNIPGTSSSTEKSSDSVVETSLADKESDSESEKPSKDKPFVGEDEKQPESSTDNIGDSSTDKQIESSTENVIPSSEVSSDKQEDDKKAGDVSENSTEGSILDQIQDFVKELFTTTMKTMTSDSEQELTDDDKIPQKEDKNESDQGQTTTAPLSDDKDDDKTVSSQNSIQPIQQSEDVKETTVQPKLSDLGSEQKLESDTDALKETLQNEDYNSTSKPLEDDALSGVEGENAESTTVKVPVEIDNGVTTFPSTDISEGEKVSEDQELSGTTQKTQSLINNVEDQKDSEAEGLSSTERPHIQDGEIVGIDTVSSTPEPAQSLSINKQTTPQSVSESSKIPELPEESEDENEIDPKDKISDQPEVPVEPNTDAVLVSSSTIPSIVTEQASSTISSESVTDSDGNGDGTTRLPSETESFPLNGIEDDKASEKPLTEQIEDADLSTQNSIKEKETTEDKVAETITNVPLEDDSSNDDNLKVSPSLESSTVSSEVEKVTDPSSLDKLPSINEISGEEDNKQSDGEGSENAGIESTTLKGLTNVETEKTSQVSITERPTEQEVIEEGGIKTDEKKQDSLEVSSESSVTRIPTDVESPTVQSIQDEDKVPVTSLPVAQDEAGIEQESTSTSSVSSIQPVTFETETIKSTEESDAPVQSDDKEDENKIPSLDTHATSKPSEDELQSSTITNTDGSTSTGVPETPEQTQTVVSTQDQDEKVNDPTLASEKLPESSSEVSPSQDVTTVSSVGDKDKASESQEKVTESSLKDESIGESGANQDSTTVSAIGSFDQETIEPESPSDKEIIKDEGDFSATTVSDIGVNDQSSDAPLAPEIFLPENEKPKEDEAVNPSDSTTLSSAATLEDTTNELVKDESEILPDSTTVPSTDSIGQIDGSQKVPDSSSQLLDAPVNGESGSPQDSTTVTSEVGNNTSNATSPQDTDESNQITTPSKTQSDSISHDGTTESDDDDSQKMTTISDTDSQVTSEKPIVESTDGPQKISTFEDSADATSPTSSSDKVSNIDENAVTDTSIHDGEDITEIQSGVTVSNLVTSVTESGSTINPKLGSSNSEVDKPLVENVMKPMLESSTQTVEVDLTTQEKLPTDVSESEITHDDSNGTISTDRVTTIAPLEDSTRVPEVGLILTEGVKPSNESISDINKSVVTTLLPDLLEVSEKLSDSTDSSLIDSESDSMESSSRVPGEGSCFVEGITYQNGSNIPPTTPCHVFCACQNSIVHCLLVHCPPPPSNTGECKPIYKSGVCCPEYDCGDSGSMTVTVTPGPGLGLKNESDFITVTPETSVVQTSEAYQGEGLVAENVNSTESVSISTSGPITSSEESSSNETDKVDVKPINDDSQSIIVGPSHSSMSTPANVALQSTTEQSISSSEETGGPVNVFVPEAQIVPVENTNLVPQFEEGHLISQFEEDLKNMTSDEVASGNYYPVTTKTTVTPSSAPWPYPTSTPASVMSAGACLFDGRVYMSAQQIPRDDPCDFCFCFRGDIICLQQSCPPPIPGCYEEPIPGFCCPRYECPVGNGNVTTQTPLFPPSYYHNQILNGVASGQNPGAITANIPTGPGCEIQGEYYESGQVITSTSGPCLECRCGATGMMECDPRECQPEPMLRKMIAAITSR